MRQECDHSRIRNEKTSGPRAITEESGHPRPYDRIPKPLAKLAWLALVVAYLFYGRPCPHARIDSGQ